MQKETSNQNTLIDTLHTISLSLAAISVIQDAARASGLFRTLVLLSLPIPLGHSISTSLQPALKPSTRPR